MSYQWLLTPPGGEAVDATERVSALTWSGSIRIVSRQVEAVMATPTDGSLPELPCELGTEARLLIDGEQRFLGHIVTRARATDGQTTTLTALDRGRFLAGNEGWYVFAGAAPEEAVRAVCQDFGIPVGALAAGGASVSRKFPGTALSQIVDTMYTMAGERTGRRFLARFTGQGALEVVEKPTSAALEIAPGRNLQTLRVTEDISELSNAVAIYTQDGTLVRTVEDQESIALYGRLQHVLTQRDGEDAGPEAQAWLEDNGLAQTLTAEVLGDPALITGNAAILRDNATGAAGLCWIDADTHTWRNRQYVCRLTLNFRNLMAESSAGQEV